MVGVKNKAFEKGKSYFYKEKYNKAEKYLLKAIKKDYSYGAAHFLLGKTYFFMGKYEQSLEYLDNSISLLAGNDEALRMKVDCLQKLGRNEEASEIKSQLPSKGSSSQSKSGSKSNVKIFTTNAVRRMDVPELTEFIRESPYRGDAWFFLHDKCMETGQKDFLYSFAREIRNADPYAYYAYQMIAEDLLYGHDFAQEDPGELIKTLKRLLALRGADDEQILALIEDILIKTVASFFTSELWEQGVDLINFVLDSRFPMTSVKLCAFCGLLLQKAGIIGTKDDIVPYINNYKPKIGNLARIGAEVTKEAEAVGK